MKAINLLILTIVVVVSAERTRWYQLDNYTFENYVAEYNKVYENAQEMQKRKEIFQQNLEKIRAHNKDTTKTWKEGVNHLTDLTVEEFKRMLGYHKGLGALQRNNTVQYTGSKLSLKDLPTSVDWRTQGVVTTVKDQGMCGSCWTFASSETIESQYAMQTGILHTISEQNILDCVPNPDQCGGTGGCGGGTPELAYGTLKNIGIASEWTYPYTSYQGSNYPCHFNKSTPAAINITGFTKLPENQYQPVMEAIATKGPIAITVEAIRWMNYESGVFDGCNQANPDLDHNVQLAGYGTDAGTDYWLVRNSWSPAWGEKGYIRLLRSASEQTRCGIDKQPGDGSGCKGGPPQVTVCGTCGILYDVCYPLVATPSQ